MWVGLVAVAIIAVSALWNSLSVTPQVVTEGPNAGSITNGTNFKYGVSIGNTSSLGVVPTNIAKILTSTCSLIATSYTVAATSTAFMDCVVTGATPTDIVFAESATSSGPNALYNGWTVVSASASSTAGFDTFGLYNGTGASALVPAQVASSTKYLNIGTQ